MNNIVKIILGLNIAAGGAGLFFAYSKSDKVKELSSGKESAESNAKNAKTKEGEYKTKWEAAASDAETKKGTIESLNTQLEGLQGDGAKAKALIDEEKRKAQTAEAAAQSANLQLERAEKIAQSVPGLESKLADYGNLGTAQSIKTKLDKLAKLEAGATSGPKKKKPRKTNVGEVGTIQNHDPQLDFYVINVGSDNGVNKGDKYTIFRAGKAIGKIEISRTQPTVSIAVYQKGFPKPSAPFRSGDKVMKKN